jgi:uncharacterized protein (TIGR00369 family)
MPSDQELLAALDASGGGAFMEKLGIEWLEVTRDRLVARLPVEGNTQPLGLFHGGASAALAETLASVAAWLIDPERVSMGIELKVNHLRSVRSGHVTGVVTPIRAGRTIQVWEIRMHDDEGRPSAFATCTTTIRDGR